VKEKGKSEAPSVSGRGSEVFTSLEVRGEKGLAKEKKKTKNQKEAGGAIAKRGLGFKRGENNSAKEDKGPARGGINKKESGEQSLSTG